MGSVASRKIMKAVVFTLGCKVNSCESASLIRGLTLKGYEVSEELSYADLYIINTCAVTSEAEKKSRQAVSRVRKFNENAPIIITGCGRFAKWVAIKLQLCKRRARDRKWGKRVYFRGILHKITQKKPQNRQKI